MANSKELLMALMVLLFFFIGADAQPRKLIPKQHLTISEGLAHNGVTAIVEDSKGYLWIGTYDGLNRYDGYEFKVYKNAVDEHILASNRVRAIKEDEKGNLWIGTDEGISIYHYMEERFQPIYSKESTSTKRGEPIIRSILLNDKKKQVLCATEGEGLLLFDENYTFIRQFQPPINFSEEPIIFNQGILLNSTNYLFATSIGVLLFDSETAQFSKVLPKEIRFSHSLSKVDAGTIIATNRFGITFFDYAADLGRLSFTKRHTTLKTKLFKSVQVDELGGVWLGTNNDGILYLDDVQALKNNQVTTPTSFVTETGILKASCITTTLTYGSWVGTFDKGLFRFDIKEQVFQAINVPINNDVGLKSTSFINLVSKDSHQVYATTIFGGAAIFDTQLQQFKKIATDKIDIARIFLVDSQKKKWVTINGESGLFRLNSDNTILEKIAYKNNNAFNNIRYLTEDKQGNFWVGTMNNVYQLSADENGQFTKIESVRAHPFFQLKKIAPIRTIYVDTLYNFVWVGTITDGLFRIKNAQNIYFNQLEIDQFIPDTANPQSISSNHVTGIIRLPNDELWIGTERGGICQVLNSDATPEFISFSEKQGLSNNVVKNILYDDENNLWISTNIGLNKFDTKTHQFSVFSKEDGLPFEDFLYSAVRLDNGQFLFAGVEGICYFNPKKLPALEALPQLEFGEFKLFNEVVLPMDTVGGRILLDKHLRDKKEITLQYNENVFSIELTSLHFSNPENHYLKYQLLPINEDWIQVPSNQRVVQYSGLQPANYELQVMASNSFDEWTQPKILKLTIQPPWWKTTQAYLFYLLATAFLIAAIVFYILRLQQLQHNLAIEQLEKDKAKEINAAKLRFFSNISHEIKTPLTLISGPIELLTDRFKSNKDIKDKLQLVQRQAKKMLQLVNRVQDFQRADANLLEMHPSHFHFDSFIKDLKIDFDFLAKRDNKSLLLKGEEVPIYVSADKDKLEKVFNNLLNNAFKHTNTNDSIRIDFESTPNDLIIYISDTGKGIHAEDLPHIFQRFYQSKHNNKNNKGGSGIGLTFTKRLVEMHEGSIHAESKLGLGTKFTLRLPIIVPISKPTMPGPSAVAVVKEEVAHLTNIAENLNLSSIKVAERFLGASVFVVEDDRDMCQFIAEVLAHFFKVKTFTNGQECLTAMVKEWPAIVVSDVQMPEMNGFELCKQIKSAIQTSHIPVILLTANNTMDKQIQGISEGADAYLSKPFNIPHLVTRIESLLRNREQLKVRFQTDFPLSLEKGKGNSKDHDFLEKLHYLMAENLDNQEVDLDAFAKELNMNRTHFYQKVKALTDQTPFGLLKTYRLKKAAEFLVQQDLSVNEVFMRTGFKSRTHFSKLFKEKYQVSPGKFAAEAAKKYNGDGSQKYNN